MTINRQERSSIAKIINERFTMLQRDFDQRRDELSRAIRERAIEEAKGRCAEATARMQPLIAEARLIQDRIEQEVAAIRDELDVFPGQYTEQVEWLDQQGKRTRKVIKASHANPVSLHVNTTFAPDGVEERIAEELAKLGDERFAGGRKLDVLRLDLQEELLTGGLDTEAKAFLERIPTLDALLPPELPAVASAKPSRKRVKS